MEERVGERIPESVVQLWEEGFRRGFYPTWDFSFLGEGSQPSQGKSDSQNIPSWKGSQGSANPTLTEWPMQGLNHSLGGF